jgi:hypothetical protein
MILESSSESLLQNNAIAVQNSYAIPLPRAGAMIPDLTAREKRRERTRVEATGIAVLEAMMRYRYREDYSEQDSKHMSNDSDGPSLAKRSGELVLYGIFIFVDAIEIWPHTRLAAVVLAFVGFVALLAIDGGFSRPQNMMFVGSAAIVCVAAYFLVPEPLLPEIEIIGSLQPGNDADPANVCTGGVPMPPDSWKTFVGNTIIYLGKTADLPVLGIGRCKLLAIHRDEGGLSVTANLFDANGRLTAVIKNNEFRALLGDGSHIERGHDLAQISVIDKTGKEILYVRYLNKASVRVRGQFGCPGHSVIPVKDNEPIPNVIMQGTCFKAPDGLNFGIGGAFFAVDPPLQPVK